MSQLSSGDYEPAASSGLAPLGVHSYTQATVFPVAAGDVAHRMRIGVFRSDGTVVEATLDDRHHGSHTFYAADPSGYGEPRFVDREVIYAGAYYGHFGHFLLEGHQRLWWAAEHPELPIVWVGPDTWAEAPELNSWQRDMLNVTGVTNDVMILTEPVRFPVVHVPDAGFKYADWSHPEHIAFLAKYPGPEQVPGSKLWLSRNGNHGVGVVNSEIIERKLIALGWDVVRPECLPLREQLDVLARAETIAGEEGSAFHTLLLLEDVSEKHLDIFRRHGPEHPAFRTIGDARGLDQTFHSCSNDSVLAAEGRGVVRLAPNPSQYLSHLGVPIPEPPQSNPSPTIRTINRLAAALGAQTFLQLGWSDHSAFKRVRIERRDIVAPEFGFDVRSFTGRRIHFWEVTLDKFLSAFADGRAYDLVHLDNAESGELALEQLRAVLAGAAHERTVFVLDDALPLDLAGTTKDAGRPSSGRETAPDLYRVVFTLHDEMPELNFRTIVTRDRTHTVIWREQHQRTPRFSSPEATIATTSRADVVANLDLFALVDESDMFAAISRALPGVVPPPPRAPRPAPATRGRGGAAGLAARAGRRLRRALDARGGRREPGT